MEKKVFNIGIELDADFVDCLNGLIENSSHELAILNGFASEQLNYTGFIDKFLANDTVADASIDGNSNVHHHDVVTMEHEMVKPHEKVLSFNKLFYELKKKYGLEDARRWLEDEWNGRMYLHDGYNASLKQYCLKPEECCFYLLNGKTIYANFKQIYNMLNEEEFIDYNGVRYKEPKNLCVQDIVNGKSMWTNVYCISKKETDEGFRYVKAQNGFDLITTENHKYILSDGDVAAKDLTLDNYINTKKQICLTNSINYYNGLELTKDLGYIIGMYLSEGYNTRGQLTICQSEKSKETYNKIISTLDRIGIPYNVYSGICIRLKNGDNNWERKILTISQGKYAWEKCLCPDFIHFNKNFLNGVIAGIIDGDGTIANNKTVMIRMTSRTLINQLKVIGHDYGVYFSGTVPYIQKQKGQIQQKHIMYSCCCNMNQNKDWFLSLGSIKIQQKFTDYSYCIDYSINTVFNDGEIQVKNNEIIAEADNTVFDLSTGTSHFLCNGIQIHNCFAIDIECVARRGLFFLDNYNAQPPKHFTTFNQMVVETVSYLSNRQSGAVGLPSYLVWAWWFWWNDCKDGFYLKSPEYYRDQCLQEIVYRLNQPFLRNSIESAFTNFSVFDRPYFEAFFGGLEFPDGTYAIDHEEDIIQFEKDFMELEAKIRSENMMTYPVLSFSMQRVGGKFVDEEFAHWACKFNMLWNDSNFLVTEEITSAASCCRLVSNVNEVDKDVPLGVCNSIGGTSLNVGSVKVNTINLARLAYESKNTEDYLNRVYNQSIMACELLDVQRHTIQRNIEKGLLPNFTSGMLHIERMFSTIGVIGVYEACEHFNLISKDEFGYVHYTPEARELGNNIFSTIHRAQNDFRAKYNVNYQMNIEQIPGERAAVVLKEKDKMFYPDELYTLPGYGNQFVPLGIKTTMQERVEVDGLYDQACNSGCILHFNLDAPLHSENTAWDLINYICDQGVTYFAFVTKISACKNNHGFYSSVCPICGEPKDTEYTKIVGFLTPVKTWSKERKAEFQMRDWMDLNSMEDLQ